MPLTNAVYKLCFMGVSGAPGVMEVSDMLKWH